jgi:hypothetical protein
MEVEGGAAGAREEDDWGADKSFGDCRDLIRAQQVGVGNKKPTQKNPPKKTHLKKPTKNGSGCT